MFFKQAVLSKSGSGFSAERSDVLKKVKKGCSFRASLSLFFLCQCLGGGWGELKEMYFGGVCKKIKF